MVKPTITVGLLVANELIMLVVPDILVYISSKASYNFIFFTMTLNKGILFYDHTWARGKRELQTRRLPATDEMLTNK